MTEAGWTRDKPKEAGWYWWRQEKGMMEVPREVVYSPFYRGLVTQGERLIAGDGEWLGPITPDSFQQGRVAGLEAIRQFCVDYEDCCLLGMVSHQNKAVTNAAIGVIQFIRRQIDDLLAQQAQEGGVGDAER